jgi:hypothetical protein
MAGMIAISLFASGLSPALATETAAATTEKAAENGFMQVSDDVYKAMRDVRAARLAIFNGLTDQAKDLVATARQDIAAGVNDAQKYAIDIKTPTKEGDMYVPFDANLALADSFVATPEKAKHIANANQHLMKGEQKEAIETLKLASIDVVFTAAMLPVKLAQTHIDDAAKLIDQDKYYEANLALKAVEDSVFIDSYGIEDVPTANAEAKK